jgi:hypothetical protein
LLKKAWMMKQTVPVDQLLAWAIGTMKADKVARTGFTGGGPAGSLTSAISEMIALGVRVQKSGFAETVLGNEALAASPDMRDALTLYAACFGVAERWLDVGQEQVSIMTEAEAGKAGFQFTRAHGSAWIEPMRHSPLFGQAGAMLRPALVLGAVLTHARNNDAPDWHEGYVRPAPTLSTAAKRKNDGTLQAVSDAERHAHVVYDRAIYAAWHAALCDLAGQMAGQMENHEAAPPAALAEPWRAARDRRSARARVQALNDAISA